MLNIGIGIFIFCFSAWLESHTQSVGHITFLIPCPQKCLWFSSRNNLQKGPWDHSGWRLRKAREQWQWAVLCQGLLLYLIRRHKINRRACISKTVLLAIAELGGMILDSTLKKYCCPGAITLNLIVAVSQLSPSNRCTEDDTVPPQITCFVLWS